MKSRLNLPAKLARGRKRFEKWRSKHKMRTRLPAPLWSAAVKLAHEYGLNRTARALRLDYSGLKKRIDFCVSGGASQTSDEPKFMELLPSGTNSAVECTIEYDDAKGAKIRIHLKGPQLPDLVALSGSLWNGTR